MGNLERLLLSCFWDCSGVSSPAYTSFTQSIGCKLGTDLGQVAGAKENIDAVAVNRVGVGPNLDVTPRNRVSYFLMTLV